MWRRGGWGVGGMRVTAGGLAYNSHPIHLRPPLSGFTWDHSGFTVQERRRVQDSQKGWKIGRVRKVGRTAKIRRGLVSPVGGLTDGNGRFDRAQLSEMRAKFTIFAVSIAILQQRIQYVLRLSESSRTRPVCTCRSLSTPTKTASESRHSKARLGTP